MVHCSKICFCVAVVTPLTLADSTTAAGIANFYAVLLSRFFAKLRPLSRITARFAKQSYKKDCRKLGTKMSSFDVRFLTTLLEPMRKIGRALFSYLISSMGTSCYYLQAVLNSHDENWVSLCMVTQISNVPLP